MDNDLKIHYSDSITQLRRFIRAEHCTSVIKRSSTNIINLAFSSGLVIGSWQIEAPGQIPTVLFWVANWPPRAFAQLSRRALFTKSPFDYIAQVISKMDPRQLGPGELGTGAQLSIFGGRQLGHGAQPSEAQFVRNQNVYLKQWLPP